MLYCLFPLFRAVTSICTTIFFPLFTWTAQFCVLVFAIAVGLYLGSIGEQINEVVGLRDDSDCFCAGKASNYTVSVFRRFAFSILTFERFYSKKLC